MVEQKSKQTEPEPMSSPINNPAYLSLLELMPAKERIQTLQVPRPGPYDWHWVASHMLDHWQLDQNQPKSEIMKNKLENFQAL